MPLSIFAIKQKVSFDVAPRNVLVVLFVSLTPPAQPRKKARILSAARCQLQTGWWEEWKPQRREGVGERGGGRERKENRQQRFASGHLQTACEIHASHTLLGSLWRFWKHKLSFPRKESAVLNPALDVGGRLWRHAVSSHSGTALCHCTHGRLDVCCLSKQTGQCLRLAVNAVSSHHHPFPSTLGKRKKTQKQPKATTRWKSSRRDPMPPTKP